MTLGFAQIVSENRMALNRLRLDSSFAKLTDALAAEIAEQMMCDIDSLRQCPDAAAFAHFYASGLVGLVEWWAGCDNQLDPNRLIDAYDATVGRMLAFVEVRCID